MNRKRTSYCWGYSGRVFTPEEIAKEVASAGNGGEAGKSDNDIVGYL